MYEFSGVVGKVGEVQTFPSGFTKRELVVVEEKAGTWQNKVAFTFKQDRVGLLEGLETGTRVKVTFAVDGREWTDPKTRQVKYFHDLTGLKLEVMEKAGDGHAGRVSLQSSDVVAPTVDDGIGDDGGLPF